MGITDRIIRILVAVVIAVLYFTHKIDGIVATIGIILAAIFVLTSFISFCPLYLPFGIFTRRKD